MGKKNTEIRTFMGGVNSDDTPSFIGKDEVLNAINTTMSVEYGSDYNYNQQVNLSLRSLNGKQSTAVTSLLGGLSYTLLGKLADARTNTIYLFFYNSGGNSKIIRLTKSGTADIFFQDSFTVSGLNWNANLYISARLAGNNLIFTEPINGARFLDVTKTYTASSVANEEMSFIRVPNSAPLSCTRVTNTSVYNFAAQLGTFQFATRIKDVWGFETVLSPLSSTVYDERQSNIEANAFSGNTIKGDLNFANKIPSYWETIDFIVKDIASNAYFVYKTFNKNITADVTAVANHNSGVAALSATYEGVKLYAIDINSASKQFESMPITSEHIEVMDNRVLLANNTNGYDTPTAAPTNINIYQDTINTVMPASTLTKVYMITAKNLDLDEDKYPIYAGLFVFYDGKIWALPKEYSVLRFNGAFTLKASNLDNATYPYQPPQTVSKKSLIKCGDFFDGTFAGTFANPFPYLESLCTLSNNGFNIADVVGTVPFTLYKTVLPKFVWELHELGENPSGNWGLAIGVISYNGFSRFNDMSIYIMDEPDEFAGGGASKSFLPSSSYNVGIRYYDYAMRSCGDQFVEKVSIPQYDPYLRQLTNGLGLSITGVNTAPTWAKYFAITLSKNDACQNFINFTPTIIKIARKTPDGIKYVHSDWFNNIQSDELYGVAIPLDAFEGSNIGYSYTQGDYVRIDSATGTPIGYSGSTSYVASVIDVVEGHLIVSAPNTASILFAMAGQFSAQYDKISSPVYNGTLLAPVSAADPLMTARFRQALAYVTIYQQPQSDNSNYEVAALGYCNVILGVNQLDKFYSGTGNSATFKIFGDCHTQKRESSTASFTGISSRSNERTISTVWLGMYGRISPIDNVGKTRAINEIRWTNTGDQSLNASINGMNKFDFSDYELTDYGSGAINMILGQLGDLGRSETLLIICANGGYSTLLNQNLIRTTDGSSQLVASSKLINNIIEINGNPATSSPRSFALSPNGVFWADVLNKKVIMYSGGQSTPISNIKTKNLFYRLFKDSEANSNQAKIYGCYHSMGNEYILGYKSQGEITKPSLPTTSLEYPLSFYYQKSYSWVFNIEKQKWSSIIPKMLEPIALSEKVWAWDFVAQTFDEILNSETEPDYDSIVSIPFNSNYDYVKSALAIKIDASRAPDEVWLETNVNTRFDLNPNGVSSTQVATASDWVYREGDYYCTILRDRMSKLITGDNAEIQARNFNGTRLKGKTINVIFVWSKENGSFSANSCSLAYE